MHHPPPDQPAASGTSGAVAVTDAVDDRKRIALISTGGTIEKTYDELSGVLENRVSVLDVLLASLELRGVAIERVALMNKDSLDMTPADHTLIARTALDHAARTDGVVIVHGTDRLADTGERIVELVRDGAGLPRSSAPAPATGTSVERSTPRPTPAPAPIVLTGAMRPYALRATDAIQNVTEALLAVQLLPPGVYVCMHNAVLAFPGVVKDRALGAFRRA